MSKMEELNRELGEKNLLGQRFVNSISGGPTLPTLSCELQMLRPGEQTKAHRHASSMVYHLGRGLESLPEDVRRRILSENAAKLYGLEI
jgi:gentisate 1,2-dioxygenase